MSFRPQYCAAVAGLTLASLLISPDPLGAQAATHIRTRWAASVSAAHVLPGYPRPQMVRTAWSNLNGRWDYAITPRDAGQPSHWDGAILVPFPVQSQLSGVDRAVTDSQRLWYHRTFTAPSRSGAARLLLHFGAVDWDATVRSTAARWANIEADTIRSRSTSPTRCGERARRSWW